MILGRILQCDDDDFEDDDVGDDYPGWWWLNWCWKIKAPSDGDHQPSKPFCSKEELRRRNQNWKGVVLPIWIYVTVYWGDWANIYRIPRTWLHCTKIMMTMPGIWMNATFFFLAKSLTCFGSGLWSADEMIMFTIRFSLHSRPIYHRTRCKHIAGVVSV